MKFSIKSSCPYCGRENFKEYSSFEEYELNCAEVISCKKCSNRYVISLAVVVEEIEYESDEIYSSRKARIAHKDVKAVASLIEKIIKLYETETNCFSIDFKRYMPKIIECAGPISELEDYVIKNGNIPFGVLEQYRSKGYTITAHYEGDYFHLSMAW